MEDKEFDKLTPEEKKARFQKAVDDYNSGFVEVDYTFRSVASIRVEEAMEDAGRVSEEFKPAQIKVIYEAAEADLNLEHYMNPKFSASHMKFINKIQEMHGLCSLIVTVNDNIEIIAGLGCNRNELLAICLNGAIIIHQVHISIRCKRAITLLGCLSAFL